MSYPGAIPVLLERCVEPALVTDSSGLVLALNGSLRALLSQTADNKVYETIIARLPKLCVGNEKRHLSLPAYAKGRIHLEATPLPDVGWLVEVRPEGDNGVEARKFQEQRLQTLGEIAGGVAHDFNNMLTGILGHTTYLKAILPGSGKHLESLSAIEHGARRAADMTQQILNFSKLDTSASLQHVELCELVRRTCTLLRRSLAPDITFETNMPAETVSVCGQEGRLAQVVVNLVVNARDALSANGRIHVEVALLDAPDVPVTILPEPRVASRYAVLRVADNGCGMLPEVQARIFEPYFSTKREKGTGLGLSTVRSIVDQHGGVLHVASALGQGTTMELYLPFTESPTAVTEDERGELELRGGERVLIVDDEHPVRTVLYLGLEQLGYAVETASSGAEAIERFRSGGDGFDIVVLDMLMPKLSGEEVFFELKDIDTNTRFIIASGFAPEKTIQRLRDAGAHAYLAKPFTIEDLARTIRRLMSAA